MSIVAVKQRVAALGRKVVAGFGYRLVPEWRLKSLDQSEHLDRLFRLLEIDCVLDVGANIGQYHEFLRLHVGYAGSVVSFEPVAEMYEQLERKCARDPSWSVHRTGLGDADAAGRMHVLSERTLSSLLLPNEENLRRMRYEKYLRETKVARTEDISVRRLDTIEGDVIPAECSRLFLKSDTQGYDMAVVRGASGCLHRILGLQIELTVREVYSGAAHYLEAVAELTQMGYAVTGFFPVQRDSALRVVNVDCVMVREEEVERLRALGRHAPGQADRP